MKLNFIVFNKQEGEIKNAYSLVDNKTLKTIPTDIILKKKKVDNQPYTQDELEKMLEKVIRATK